MATKRHEITEDQLDLADRLMRELMDEGVTNSMALEIQTKSYLRVLYGYSTQHADQIVNTLLTVSEGV